MNENAPTADMVPFLIVADMEKSFAFYVDGLGFECKNEWRPGGSLKWCLLRLAGAGVMLQAGDEGSQKEKGVGVRLCVFCDDAIGLYHNFRRRGLEPEEPYVGNALWVTAVTDPDGYHIDFESPTDVAEETRLSELPANR